MDIQEGSGTAGASGTSTEMLATPLSCPGIAVLWKSGSIWTTYPYQRHEANSLSCIPIAFDHEQDKIFLRSHKHIEEDKANDPCLNCQHIPNLNRVLKFLARCW
ncbi:hypothetical protein BDQ17DRAFT_1358570 [Cyathus striatus]|nr:hypothetical protein BDQ17DRAFT_1358570 [Cyathus striatus]